MFVFEKETENKQAFWCLPEQATWPHLLKQCGGYDTQGYKRQIFGHFNDNHNTICCISSAVCCRIWLDKNWKIVISLIPFLTLLSMIFHIQVLRLLKYSGKQPGCQYLHPFARFNPDRTCRNNVKSELLSAQWNHWK